jgi:NCS1 family nucleobase:cation symporter-1
MVSLKIGTEASDVLMNLTRTNKDLDPVPRHARKWGVTSFISYWISDAFK